MSKELAKTYDPHGIEEKLYQKWLEKKYFHAEVDHSKKPFTIVMGGAKVEDKVEMTYKDIHEISDYAVDSVAVLTKLGVIHGNNGYFMPKNNATRAETSKVLYNILKEE